VAAIFSVVCVAVERNWTSQPVAGNGCRATCWPRLNAVSTPFSTRRKTPAPFPVRAPGTVENRKAPPGARLLTDWIVAHGRLTCMSCAQYPVSGAFTGRVSVPTGQVICAVSCTTGRNGYAIAQRAANSPSTTDSQRHSNVPGLVGGVVSGRGCSGSVTSPEVTVGVLLAIHIERTLSPY
jgi:hypothetical protein